MSKRSHLAAVVAGTLAGIAGAHTSRRKTSHRSAPSASRSPFRDFEYVETRSLPPIGVKQTLKAPEPAVEAESDPEPPRLQLVPTVADPHGKRGRRALMAIPVAALLLVGGAFSPLSPLGASADSNVPTVAFTNAPQPGQWFHTGRAVVVVATAPSTGSLITGIVCTLAGHQITYPAVEPMQSETVNVGIAPPGGQLACTATDQAGDTGPQALTTFNIDAHPPAGALIPEPADPAAVVAHVTATSGIARVVLEAHSPRGWVPLHTSYDEATGQAHAALSPSQQRWGHVPLRALATDNAGEHAALSTYPSGNLAAIELPARAPYRLTGQIERSPIPAADYPFNTIPPQSLIKHGSGAVASVASAQHAPTGLTIYPHQHAALQGVVTGIDSKPAVGVRLVMQQRIYGTSAWVAVASWHTDSRGGYSIPLPAGPSRQIRLLIPGSSLYQPVALYRNVKAVGTVSLRLSADPSNARRVLIAGRVLGGRIPISGLYVSFWYRRNATSPWIALAAGVRADAAGYFRTFNWKPPVTGRLQFHATVSPANGWAWWRAASVIDAYNVR